MKLGHNIFVTGDTVTSVCVPADSVIVDVQQETYNNRTVKASSPEVFQFTSDHNTHQRILYLTLNLSMRPSAPSGSHTVESQSHLPP